MSPRPPSRTFHAQSGAITILVALMLLVLLTVAAIGMSRNSFREVVISGTARQGAMTRNAADAGIEWGIYWMDPTNALSNPGGTPANLIALKTALLQDPTKGGQAYDATLAAPTLYAPNNPPAPPADQTFTTLPTTAQGFTLGLTKMGKLPLVNMGQVPSGQGFAPATGKAPLQAPDLWAVRSDAQVKAGLTFIHAKEAWISTPVQ